MALDKSWMTLRNRMSKEYRDGVQSFIEFATRGLEENAQIYCPCVDCLNHKKYRRELVAFHLVRRGISPLYKDWAYHGEIDDIDAPNAPNCNLNHEDVIKDGPTIDDANDNDDLSNMLEDYYMSTLADEDHDDVDSTFGREEAINFDKLFDEAQRPVYPGCKNFTVLSFIIKMLHIKVLYKLTNTVMDVLFKMMKDFAPECDANVPWTLYQAKKFLHNLGLGYVGIDACKHDCVLFWKENAKLQNCPTCKEPRYKHNDGLHKNVANKILRYFPLTPRLKRLYMSRKTAKDMRWHNELRVNDGVLRHPADGKEWKEFNRRYPNFGREPRNVRLGLATDGFNPFGNMSNSYSMWPIIVMPYNLPHWKCMKESFCMMSLLIPGPKAPGREIDVYMRPLIDELKELWEHSVQTYDAFTGDSFHMHAAIMWIINDFPAYGNLSGWSTKGYLACPACNKDTSSQGLRDKIGYTGARRFLPKDHPWRRSMLFDGKVEIRSRPMELTGEDILDQLDSEIFNPFGKSSILRKIKRNKDSLNWSKKSIFFELPYWKSLKLRHNLDVMHIEKNICDNVLGTLLSMEGKNKDTNKARLDLADLNIRKELHLKRRTDGSFEKPPALYTLSVKERQGFYDFLKSIKYPDGYAANISRCVNTTGGKLSGLKSHDCHVLIQQILPIGMRGYLSSDICTTLFELVNFFQDLCSKTLREDDLKKLDERIIIILCKMEKIFPPAFFDMMVHLAIHLPYEAMIAGPVQYRWMYPIERLLGVLKKHISNRARPEGSIAEAYIMKECLTFCSMYIGSMETVFNREERNYDGRVNGHSMSAFKQTVRPFGRIRGVLDVTEEKLQIAKWFVLYNSVELDKYLEEHKTLLESQNVRDIAKNQQQEFPIWFKKKMNQLRSEGSAEATDEMWSLANGPITVSNQYAGCICNGVRFHNKDRDNRRQSQNSGVVVEGEHHGHTFNFYGYLCKVWELEYRFGCKVLLFECAWFNSSGYRTFRTDAHVSTIDIKSRWYQDDPFVFPNQVQKVFYINDTKYGENWRVIQKIQHRGIWNIPEGPGVIDPSDEEITIPDEIFQQEGITLEIPIVIEDDTVLSLQRNDIDSEIISSNIVQQATIHGSRGNVDMDELF